MTQTRHFIIDTSLIIVLSMYIYFKTILKVLLFLCKYLGDS